MKKLLLLSCFAFLFATYSFAQTINQPNDLFVCDDAINDGIADFDIESQTPQILGSLSPDDYTVTYHETQADADQQVNALVSPYTNSTNPQTIYVAVIENATGNLETISFNLVVNTLPINGFAQDVIVCDEGGGFGTFDLTLFDLEFSQGKRIEDSVTGCAYVNPDTVLYLNVDQTIFVNEPTPLVVCDDNGDGFFTFNLESKYDEILNGNQTPNVLITFHETLADAENFNNVLDPIYTNITPNLQSIYVRVGSTFGDCFQTTTLDLVIETDCLSVSPAEISFCTDDPNFVGDFDLTSQNSEIVNGEDVSGFNFSYYLTESDANTQNNPIINPTSYQVNIDTLIIYVYVEAISSGDSAVTTLVINGNINPIINFNGPYAICSGEQIVLTPEVFGGSGVFNYLWSTGDTNPEIVIFQGGTYTVDVEDGITGCTSTLVIEISEGISPTVGSPSNLSSCEPNATYDLTSVIPEILNGANPNDYSISFYNVYDFAFLDTNPILNITDYNPANTTDTIYIRVQNSNDDCFIIVEFLIITEDTCPIVVDCGEDPVNTNYCYDINDATQYIYESSDGSQLQVNFIAGQVEDTWDELIVLDSDGVTNLNPEATTYGNNGDLTGLSFTSSGSTITVYVDSDQVFSCVTENYTPIDYNVSCLDPNAVPICNSSLTSPINGEEDVNENTDITWSASSGNVNGYKISVGITSGGTEIIDNEDVGDVLTYAIGTLDYEVTYYVTIIPYNDNGDGVDCTEENFTTRANPNQTVVCEDGAINTTYCYGNNDTSEFNFASSDGQALTLFFNSGGTEINFDTVTITDSDGTILNPTLPYGNDGDFTDLTYTSSGGSISVSFDSDSTVSCASGSGCCTEQFDFDVFCNSSVGIIEVNAFVDANTNSVFDSNEFSFSNGYFTYEANGDGIINTVNSSTGSFQIIATETDTYEIMFYLYEESAGCYDITTSTFSNVSVANGSTLTVDFPVVEEQSCEDLAVYLVNGWIPPRPGFTHENSLIIENLGFTTISSGTIEFVHDPLLVYNTINYVNPNYIITNTATGFTVDFVNLQPGDVEYIDISLTCPVSVELGDIVTNTATYITDSNDLVEVNNFSTLSEVVVGSWDPNDKMEAHGPRILYDDFVSSDEYLYYTIRFQNLGTFPATFVRIEDMLNSQLDETTFQMLRSSHDYVVTRTDSSLEWFFEDINLPAEQDDVDGSQGFVYFKIKPKAGYSIGDIIPNTAAIFFDFNAPVITNRFDSQFVEESLSVSENDFISFDLLPNPANEIVTITLNSQNSGKVVASVIDIQGKQILETHILDGTQIQLDVSDIQSGMYFVKISTNNRNLVKKLIIE